MMVINALFLSAILLLCMVLLVVFGSPSKAITYLRENKAVTKGILLFMGAGYFISAGLFYAAQSLAEPVKYLSYSQVYLGLDRTFSPSPMAEFDGPDNRLTSNGGVEVNIISYGREYNFGRMVFDTNIKYTHHSAAVNEDRENYDAIGAALILRLER